MHTQTKAWNLSVLSLLPWHYTGLIDLISPTVVLEVIYINWTTLTFFWLIDWWKATCGRTAAAPASEVEAVVRSPRNMAAANIAAVDFIKKTSKWRHSTGLLAAMFVGEDLLANRRLQTILLLCKTSREYLITRKCVAKPSV